MTRTDPWASADNYERFMGRWSRLVARRFVEWLTIRPFAHWLEVGCGTGALSEEILRAAQPSSLIACDPSDGFIAHARRSIVHPSVTFLTADANHLPRRDPAFDAIVSGLVLNHLADPKRAVLSMANRLAIGGTLAAYVWDYADGIEFLRVFWDTAVKLNPAAVALNQAYRYPLCQPDALVSLFQSVGLHSIEVRALEILTPFPDFNSYWEPFLGGTGEAPAYVASLDEVARETLRLSLFKRLAPSNSGDIRLSARAWAVRGTGHSSGSARGA